MNFFELKEYARNNYNINFTQTDKIVMIGDKLWEDVVFGNICGMTTIYVPKLNYGTKSLDE